MASLKLLLGLIPSTSKLEQKEKALVAEFDKLNTFTSSDVLARYNELNGLVKSPGFIERCKEIKALRYKDSGEYDDEKEFLSLQKARDIVMYFKTSSGSMLKRFRELDGSAKINEFEALEKYIESPAFREKQKMKPITFKDSDEYRKFVEYKSLKKDPEVKSFFKAKRKEDVKKGKAVLRYEELDAFVKSSAFLTKKNMKPITFKDTEEYKKLLEYKRIKNSIEIREYYKFKASKEYSNYLETDNSARLKRYYELKDWVATSEFKERKAYLLDKKKFEKTDMYREIKEYDTLRKNKDIIWYFKIKDSDKFDILKGRELIFSDEFDADRLDSSKWITNYYWGDKLFKERFSVESDLQAFTEKENFEIRNSILRITTKPQKTQGKVWTSTKGFSTKEFNYTSGLINTGNSFRQKYGIFSAKVRLGNPVAKSAFWMLADKITPHLDVCRTGSGKVWCDYFPARGKAVKNSIPSKFAKDYFIYTLEWTPDKLVWKINDTEIFTQTSDLPQDPMYLLFAGGLDKPISGSTSMEIDWVRVYKAK